MAACFSAFWRGVAGNALQTRRAYLNVTRRFAAWCSQKNIDELSGVQPFHVVNEQIPKTNEIRSAKMAPERV